MLNKDRLLGIAILAAIFAFAWWGSVKYINKPAEDPQRRIVVFHAMSPEGKWEKELISSFGGSVLKQLPLINGVAAEIPDGALETLKKQPAVDFIEKDFFVTGKKDSEGLSAQNDTRLGSIPGRIFQPGGDIVKVGVLDSGADINHPWLSEFLGEGLNVLDPGRRPVDVLGHGTHVAGIIAHTVGQVSSRKTQIRIYPVKVFNYFGQAYLSDIIMGLEWCRENRMSVVNMSFGTARYSQALEEAVKEMAQSGVLMVAAAGNKGPKKDSVLYPAKFFEVIAVSASTGKGDIAVFSSRGPEIIFIVPGMNIESAWKNGGYAKETGTSMAAPQVAGVIAVMLGMLGQAEQEEIVALLQNYTDDLGLPPECQGYGRIDFKHLENEIEFLN